MCDASTRVLDVKKRSSGAAIGMVPNFMVHGGFGCEARFTFFRAKWAIRRWAGASIYLILASGEK